MRVLSSIPEVRKIIKDLKSQNLTIGLVPTMGCLHQGHLSLVEKSKQFSDYQVMSIFINRLQFNDPEDFKSYPQTLEKDLKLAEKQGVDLVFLPHHQEMYHHNLTTIQISDLTNTLCGAHRPGHFPGVFTVVSKLFNIIQPDLAVFGQKDIQQVIGIEKMVLDLNFPLQIIIAPIVREKNGLAMSSRNNNLTVTEKEQALVLYQSLQKAQELITAKELNPQKIKAAMKKIIDQGQPTKIDYISIVKGENLQPASKIEGRIIIALAVSFGPTRLIDNMIVGQENQGFKFIY